MYPMLVGTVHWWPTLVNVGGLLINAYSGGILVYLVKH
jgi:hypothetical protein